ncbi:MAG: hypothetical protein K6F59_05265 [Gammaproteobacteria bacterium]|nr:hypothetical protein [Gammaproteobacteria bacterium]
MNTIMLMLSLLFSMKATKTIEYYNFYNSLTYEEQLVLDSYDINNYEELFNLYSSLSNEENESYNHSTAFFGARNALEEEFGDEYDDYTWYMNIRRKTSNSSNAIPIEVCSDSFPTYIIQNALNVVDSASTYGGCGPIAMIGILDYFARYLDYDEIMENPNLNDNKLSLAVDVLRESKTYEIGWVNDKSTLMFPADYVSAFNNLMIKYGLEGVIFSSYMFKLLSGQQDEYWNKVVDSINGGFPVTLMVGIFSPKGDFDRHYSNIIGYEVWTGYHKVTGQKVVRKYLIARLNKYEATSIYYCNADILNDGMVALITYDILYDHFERIYAADFQEEFVNQNGGGQYYFDERYDEVNTVCGDVLYTRRLRTSYIENKYLVLSPNRDNAGIAYLDIAFTHHIGQITFDAALWSAKEGIQNESFEVQYSDDGIIWKTISTVDLNRMTIVKENPDTFTILLPKNVARIRFIAKKINPSGDRNKGRIIIDNIRIKYFI